MVENVLEKIQKMADPYERKARLYPALIALVPVLGIVIGVYGVALKLDSAFIGLATYFGIFYFLATVGRELGKRKEPHLFMKWGGKPTTQILRHSDTKVDPVTKQRYHAFLAKHLGVVFPTAEDERANPEAADSVYQAGTQWLLGKTRDTKKFSLLFKENIAYGFRRNCFGMKWIGLAFAVGALLWSLFASDVVAIDGMHFAKLEAMPIGAKVSTLLSIFMSVLWLFFFTAETVRSAAFSYADMLMRACDVLPKKR